MKFFESKLSNGMPVIAEVNTSAASAALGFFVRTGARDETPEVSGVSHFLEHMLFKGTPKRSALQLTYDLGRIGAQANAFTSEEKTVYYMQFLPEYFNDAMEIITDMLRPSLDSGEFDTEKNVILEEIALYKDRPTYLLYEAAIRKHFAGHTAGNSVLGTTESITALRVEQMREYFNARYSPSNMVLVAAGNMNWENFLEQAERYCAHWTVNAVQRELRPHHPESSLTTLTKENLQMAHACLIAEGPSEQSELRYPAHVLSCILGDSSGSKTYWELIDPGLADSAYIDFEDMDHAGYVLGYVSAEPARIDEVVEKISRIMSTPLEFSDEDLARALTKLRTRMVLQGESSMRRLMALGLEWLARKRYRSLEHELERLKLVSRDDIRDLLTHVPFQPLTQVRLLPAD